MQCASYAILVSTQAITHTYRHAQPHIHAHKCVFSGIWTNLEYKSSGSALLTVIYKKKYQNFMRNYVR